MQLIRDVAEAIAQGRAAAQRLVIVATMMPPEGFAYGIVSENLRNNIEIDIIDCYTDPYGWNCDPAEERHESCEAIAGSSNLQKTCKLRIFSKEWYSNLDVALQDLRSRIFPAEKSSNTVVFIDSIDPFIDYFGLQRVSHELLRWRTNANTSSMVYRLHSDLLEQHEIQVFLQDVAHIIDATEVVLDSQQSEQQPGNRRRHGRLNIYARRRAGGVRREVQDYFVNRDGTLLCFDPVKPTLQVTTEAAVSSSINALEDASTVIESAKAGEKPIEIAALRTASMQPMAGGGMRLELTEKEEEARREVSLPYEHRGQGSLYGTTDYRDYLPSAAGGWRDKGKRLGHIQYVRDSDSEDPDSDEDPDDDLDI